VTREEYLAAAKRRALAYLERGDLEQACNSMESDLARHPETRNCNAHIVQLGLLHVLNHDIPGLRRWIEGFN
jgi:Tfp pilus assembly protein PilF